MSYVFRMDLIEGGSAYNSSYIEPIGYIDYNLFHRLGSI